MRYQRASRTDLEALEALEYGMTPYWGNNLDGLQGRAIGEGEAENPAGVPGAGHARDDGFDAHPRDRRLGPLTSPPMVSPRSVRYHAVWYFPTKGSSWTWTLTSHFTFGAPYQPGIRAAAESPDER